MTDPREVCETVRSAVDEVLINWQGAVQDTPGLQDLGTLDTDSLPQLLDAAMDVLLSVPDAPTARHALVKWGIEHGRDRVKQAVNEALIFKEYHVLREAVWTVVRDHHGVGVVSASVITALDAVFSVAAQASLRGYFHEHFGEEGSEAAPGIVADSPWPPPLVD